MQRLEIFADDDGQSHFFGITPEVLTAICKRVSGSAEMKIIESPSFADAAPSTRSELVVMMSGVHEYGTSDGVRRLFPGDILILEDESGKGHTLETFGKEKAISLHFPITHK